MAISRYIDKGVPFPIYQGLYSTVPLALLNPLEPGQAIIHRYTYLTTETVLKQAGVISQAVYEFTFVTDQPNAFLPAPGLFDSASSNQNIFTTLPGFHSKTFFSLPQKNELWQTCFTSIPNIILIFRK